MTNLQALISEVEPYTVSENAYQKRLTDNGISADAMYTQESKTDIAKCAISVLLSLLPLSSDSAGHSSQSYNKEGLEERIKAICDENGFNSYEYMERPSVKCYKNLF